MPQYSTLCLGALLASQALAFTLDNLPNTWQPGQYGTNNPASQTNSQTSNTQNLFINDINDFCLFAPPITGVTIGDSERYEVAWCTQNHGTRSIPAGTITGAHYLETPHYIQITGTGNFAPNMNIPAGDQGGELDPHGIDGNGNPIGGLVFHNGVEVKEWHQFISSTEFCIRICTAAPDALSWCQHIYDIQGCYWNDPGNYGGGFDTCKGDGTVSPPGVYVVNGQSSTFNQDNGGATPRPHAAGASSQCTAVATIGGLAIAAPAAPATTPAAATPSSARAQSSASPPSPSPSTTSTTSSSSSSTSSRLSSSVLTRNYPSTSTSSTASLVAITTRAIAAAASTAPVATPTPTSAAGVLAIAPLFAFGGVVLALFV